MHRLLATFVAALVATAALAPTPAIAGAEKRQKPLRILVTNDDGVTANGIDALVEGLRELKGVKVTVVAPTENQSGVGSSTSPTLPGATEVQTLSGYPAIAVAGFPADSVLYALDANSNARRPHLVISGINQGQNVGSGTDTSGTVGAAKTAAARGIPALAVSQNVGGTDPTFDGAVAETLRWLREHRSALAKTRKGTVILENLNVPLCVTGGEIRGRLDLPVAGPEFTEVVAPTDCTSTLEDPANDVEGINNGFVTISTLPVPTT